MRNTTGEAELHEAALGGRAAVTAVLDRLRVAYERTGGDPDAQLDLLSAAAEASTTTLMSAGGTRAGTELPELAPELNTGLVRALLLGLPRPAGARDQAIVHRIHPDRDYLAFRARPGPGHRHEELAAELTRSGDGLVVRLDGELAGFLSVPPAEPRTGLIGLGPPRTPDRLAESFHLAGRALECARAFGLTGVHSFETLGLLPTIHSDADVGESLRRRYVWPAAGIESQPDLLRTIRTYFACGMHVDRTAKELFLHANTLRYRIARFEELTGATLSTPTVAMQVWWALQHDSLAGR